VRPLCKPLIPNQIDLSQFRSNLTQFLPECFAHGKFPMEDPEKQIILMSWLERHEQAWRDVGGMVPVTCFGLDVARSLQGDRTVLAAGGDKGMRAIHQMQIADVTQIADEVLRIAFMEYGIDLKRGQTPVAIDYAGGYGAGVGDPLKRMGVWVLEFQPSGTAEVLPRVYANLRAESYALLGTRLDPANQFRSTPWALPTIEGLREELTAPEKQYSSDMVRFKVGPKEEIKQLLGRSPDLADATTYLFHAVRTYHNLNEYFQQYSGAILAYPAPGTPLAASPTTLPPANPNEYRDPSVDFYLSQYGHLAGRDSPPPEEVVDKMRRFREQVQRDELLEPPPRADGGGWLDRVRWSEE